VEVVVALGKHAGLISTALRQALETREFTARVLADEELADRLGVHAVPAYIANRGRIVSGVRSMEELRGLVIGLPEKKS